MQKQTGHYASGTGTHGLQLLRAVISPTLLSTESSPREISNLLIQLLISPMWLGLPVTASFFCLDGSHQPPI